MNCCPCGIINSMFKTERATQDGMLPHPQETETPSRSNDPPRSRKTDGVTVEVKEKKKASRNIFIPEVNKVTVTYFGSEAAVHREQERTENQKQFIIHPYGCFRGYWIVVMLVVTLINVLIIPLGVSFFSEVIQKDALWLAYNVISDSLFIVDLVLNFYTGFISDDKADIVLDLNKIRNHYFKSWFLPDLLAVLPVDYGLLIAGSAGLVSTYPSGYTAVRVTRMIKITRLFSLLRLLRFFKLVRYIRIWEEVHMHGIASAIKIFYLIAIIVLLCHWNACLQFLVVLMLDFPDKSWVQVDGLVDKSIGQQYSKAMFRALCHMMTLSYGTTGIPRGLSDIWVVIISMLIGAVMYALLLASLTSVLTNSEASKQVYDIKDVIIYNCQRLVSNMPLFKDTDPNFITAMLDKLQFEMYQTNDVIIRNGALGNRMFFIDRGTVLVESANLMCQLRDGDFFGELCLITGGRRRASVKALTPCRLYSLSVTCYRTVLQLYPEVKNHIEEVAYKRLQTQDGRRLHPQTIPAI